MAVPVLKALNQTDAKALAQCAQKCFLTPYDPPWSADSFHQVLLSERAFGWKTETSAEISAEIIGFILLFDAVDCVDVLKIAVLEKARRQGLATGFLNKALAAAHGLPLRLEVAENNQAALKLYQHFGFKQIARRERYYSVPPAPAMAALVLER